VRERVAADRLRDLESVTDAALAYLPLEQLLNELLTRVVEIVEADTAAILLLDDEGRTLVARAAKGLEEEVERGVRVPVRAGFAGRIAATRQPVVIENVEQADIHNPLLREKGLKSLLGVPLMVEGSVIGVLHVGSLRRRLFTDREVDVLQRAGDRAALAINGRLTEQERGLADALQRSLIPGCQTCRAFGSRLATFRPPRRASAVTGTTSSCCRTATSASPSATSPAAGSRRPH